MNWIRRIFSKDDRTETEVEQECPDDFDSFQDEGHYYPEYKHIIEVLTKKYGFKYTGIGENCEECFYRDSYKPEKIFVHTMFCSYRMDSHGGLYGWKNRPHDVSFRSNRRSKKSQERAFEELCSYLDQYSIPRFIIK